MSAKLKADPSKDFYFAVTHPFEMQNGDSCLDGTYVTNPTLSNLPLADWKFYEVGQEFFVL